MRTKKGMWEFLTILILSLLFFSQLVAAAPAEKLSVQGRLTNTTDGNALVGTYSINFSLWNDPSAGSMLFNETQSVTTDSNGLYSVVLTPTDESIFTNPLWMALKIDADAEMSPRMNLTTSPYAYQALDLQCTDCINGTEIDESSLSISETDPQSLHTSGGSNTMGQNIAMDGNSITGIGSGGSNFDSSGNLSVNGDITITGTGTHTIAGSTNFDSNTLYIDGSANTVGIRTTPSTSLLTLDSTVTNQGSASHNTESVLEASKSITTAGASLVNLQATWDMSTDTYGIIGLITNTQTKPGNTHNMTGSITGIVGRSENLGSGTASSIIGVRGYANARDGGPVSDAKGIEGSAGGSTGNITTAYGVYSSTYAYFDGIVNNSYAIFADDAVEFSDGEVIKNVGVGVEDLTAGQSNTQLLLGTSNIPDGNYTIYSNSSKPSFFNGDVGIGTTSPDGLLDVDIGASTDTGLIVQGAASQSANLQEWQNSSGGVLAEIDSSGNYLGPNPSATNSIAVGAGGITRYGGGAGNIVLVGSGVGTRISSGSSTNTGLVIKGAASQSANLQEWQNSSGSVLAAVDSSGNVGIGTSSPKALLDINTAASNTNAAGSFSFQSNGSIGTSANAVDHVGEFRTAAGNQERLLFYGFRRDAGSAWQGAGWRMQLAVDNSFTAYNDGKAYIELSTNSSGNGNIYFGTDGADRIIIDPNGNVGIGTTSPSEKLDVKGNASINDTLYVTESGKVGIGTASPDEQLSLGRGAETDVKTYANADEAYLTFYQAQNFPDTNNYNRVLDIVAQPSNAGSWIRFLTGTASSAPTAKMVISKDGNVGIGTDSPNATLDVACPAGFTSITANNNKLGCMETDEEGTAGWYAANDDCFDTYGGRLPFQSEWYIAMNNYALNNETDDFEWVADRFQASSISYGIIVGNSSLITNDQASVIVSHVYRCWIPR